MGVSSNALPASKHLKVQAYNPESMIPVQDNIFNHLNTVIGNLDSISFTWQTQAIYLDGKENV